MTVSRAPAIHDRSKQEILQEAVRIIASGEAPNYESARQKAAGRLRLAAPRASLSDEEIERALVDYYRLFTPDSHAQALSKLRALALQTLDFFSEYAPEAIGGVVTGALFPDAPVVLHLYVDTPEPVLLALLERRLRFAERSHVVQTKGRRREYPIFDVYVDQAVLQLTLFPRDAYAQRRLRGSSTARANAAELRSLLEGRS